ncbi:MAG: ribosome silencing factor [Burkholderiaceae bacterium]|jgi:ribosome-associated protein|nr:ribosome silencing factor [Burkholderiaceae bacterium]
MSETAARKDIQKLQRAIVDGLEHVKAHDIRVFDTSHLSPLFERVLIASGTSNRQTRAIAASVRDKVRAAGLAKPRLEGEENAEWIIIDCGAAVAHVMQPAIRQYYRLEEIWGDKPVRLKIGAPKPKPVTIPTPAPAAAVKKAVAKTPAKKAAAKAAVKPAARPVAKKAPTGKHAAPAVTPKRAAPTTAAKKIAIGKTTAKKIAAKAPAKKTAARKTAARKST